MDIAQRLKNSNITKRGLVVHPTSQIANLPKKSNPEKNGEGILHANNFTNILYTTAMAMSY
jgi:hypothetical protein